MTFIKNKKVYSDFLISETFSGGIALLGSEVKSIKKKQGNIEAGRCIVRGGECFLIGVYIPPYQKNNASQNYDPYRSRTLIFTKKEKEKLALYDSTKGISLIPLSLYPKGRLIKIDIGVGKRKNKKDRRMDLRAKIEKRERKQGEVY